MRHSRDIAVARCRLEQPELETVGRGCTQKKQRRSAGREIALDLAANCMPAGVPQFLLYAGGAEAST